MMKVKTVKEKLQAIAINQALNYLEKNPVENFGKLLDWADKYAVSKDFTNTSKKFREYWDTQNSYGQLIKRALTEFTPDVRKKLLMNFFMNTGLIGTRMIRENADKMGVSVPWAILMDPTTACNLKCVGCWAAEYDKCYNLSYDKLDDIIRQGKELGIYMYIFSGGEPLVRKKDIIKLCEKHDDCVFLAFTNGTLIDEAFVKEMQRVANFTPAISIEGTKEETDMRRGDGTYDKVMRAMDLLKAAHMPFGFSACIIVKIIKPWEVRNTLIS